MYPTAYFTYNPGRLRRAEKAYYSRQQGKRRNGIFYVLVGRLVLF